MANPMWTWMDSFPDQVRQAWEMAQRWHLPGGLQPRSVTFLGIGGSAIGADLMTALYREQMNFPVSVVRGEHAPPWLGSQDVVVAISYSGDTRETLSAFQGALNSGAQGLALSAGGALIRLAQERNLPFLQIPSGFAPRAALGYTSLPLMRILHACKAVPTLEIDIARTSQTLERLRAEWGDSAGAAAGIARRILRRLPLLIGSGWTAVVARRFQAQLAENAKALSVIIETPEAHHNLIETLDPTYLDTFSPIAFYLEDTQAHVMRLREFKALREAFQTAGVESIPLLSEGADPLTRLYTLIYKGDWISYHLASLRGVDPVAIPLITRLKKALSSPDSSA